MMKQVYALPEEIMNSQLCSRRRFVRTTSLLASGFAVAPGLLFAQAVADTAAVPPVVAQGRAAGATAKIETKALRGGVSALMGSGGNIAVLPGPEGKVLIDSGYATSQPQLTAALNTLSAEPITHLINTHWHFDHTDGNEWMHAAGATILAQNNCKTRLSTTQTIAAFNATLPPSPAGAIPTMTFAEEDTVRLNGVTLKLKHYAPAHTDTDISILFSEADVLHVGDTWFNGFYPFIDYSTGGSINGMIEAANRNVAETTTKTIIIPGHGPIGTRAELVEYRDMLVSARDRVAAIKRQGKTLPEVVAAKPLAPLDAKWGGGFMKPEAFVGLVYQGV